MPLLSALLIILTSVQSTPGAQFAALATDLHNEVQARAATARAYPAQTAPDLPPDDLLFSGLSELSVRAMQLSLSMETRNGPEDLRCIYRGMAQDALNHRQALSDADIRAGRLQVFAELAYLLDHAVEIGPIADQADIAPFTGVDPGCPRGPLR